MTANWVSFRRQSFDKISSYKCKNTVNLQNEGRLEPQAFHITAQYDKNYLAEQNFCQVGEENCRKSAIKAKLRSGLSQDIQHIWIAWSPCRKPCTYLFYHAWTLGNEDSNNRKACKKSAYLQGDANQCNAGQNCFSQFIFPFQHFINHTLLPSFITQSEN